MSFSTLQIFNSKLVLASPETATDADYAAILGVIGHEVCNHTICCLLNSYLVYEYILKNTSIIVSVQYFHNWTGNRSASYILPLLQLISSC